MVSTLLVNSSICHTLEQVQGSFMEYHRMQNDKKIPTIDITSSSDKTFPFLLLSTRSFPKYAIDFSKDNLCLTETHITPE